MSTRNYAPSDYVMPSGARISLLKPQNFEMAVEVAGPNDPLLGRYHEQVINKPKKIRSCGRCGCLGHTRKNCVVYMSHNGPNRVREINEQSLNSERTNVAQIMKQTKKRPLTKNMYMIQHVRSMKPEMIQRLSAFHKFTYVDHAGCDPRHDEQDRRAIFRALYGYELGTHPGSLTGVQFKVPTNARVGNVITIRIRNGTTHRVIMQSDMKPGTYKFIAVPVTSEELPANVPEAGEAPVQRPTIPTPANVPETPSNDEPENDDIFEESSCPICMEPFTNRNKLVSKCGHQFHASCIMTWLSGPRSACSKCPTCRKPMF